MSDSSVRVGEPRQTCLCSMFAHSVLSQRRSCISTVSVSLAWFSNRWAWFVLESLRISFCRNKSTSKKYLLPLRSLFALLSRGSNFDATGQSEGQKVSFVVVVVENFSARLEVTRAQRGTDPLFGSTIGSDNGTEAEKFYTLVLFN